MQESLKGCEMEEVELQIADLVYGEQRQEERQPTGLVAQRRQKAPRKHPQRGETACSRGTSLCPEFQGLWWTQNVLSRLKPCLDGVGRGGAAPSPALPTSSPQPWVMVLHFSRSFLHLRLMVSLPAEPEPVPGLAGGTSRLSGCRRCPVRVEQIPRCNLKNQMQWLHSP